MRSDDRTTGDDGGDEWPPGASAAARLGCSHMPSPPGSDSRAALEVEGEGEWQVLKGPGEVVELQSIIGPKHAIVDGSHHTRTILGESSVALVRQFGSLAVDACKLVIGQISFTVTSLVSLSTTRAYRCLILLITVPARVAKFLAMATSGDSAGFEDVNDLVANEYRIGSHYFAESGRQNGVA